VVEVVLRNLHSSAPSSSVSSGHASSPRHTTHTPHATRRCRSRRQRHTRRCTQTITCSTQTHQPLALRALARPWSAQHEHDLRVEVPANVAEHLCHGAARVHSSAQTQIQTQTQTHTEQRREMSMRAATAVCVLCERVREREGEGKGQRATLTAECPSHDTAAHTPRSGP
jgi:hypothetical protein